MIEVYLQGAFEPLRLNEPLEATMMNMSAAMNSGMRFFRGTTDDGDELIAMQHVQRMREVEE